MRILLADDHNVVRRGLRGTIERYDGWQDCGKASDGREAVKLALGLKPDIVVLDLSLPGLNGIEAARQINLNLSQLQRGQLTPPEAEAALTESRQLGQQSLQEIRTLSYLLHPPMLDEAGLVDALKWYVDGFIKRSGIDVNLVARQGVGRLPPEVELALFRIVQESLTNIWKHSGSDTASIKLEKGGDQITLRIKDRGRGMQATNAVTGADGAESFGVGVPGMRQRLRRLGGNLEIESSSHGTVVTATMPLP